jgi:GT2 family glycosyltransferase
VRKLLEKYAALDPRIKVVFRAANGHISESSNSALALATGEFAVLFDHDDELPPHALYLVANAINEHPQADLLYSDEDKIDETGRRYDPYFKPEWNFDLMTSQNCFSHLGVYRLSLLREIGGFRKGYEGSQDYDLALRCLARTDRVVHLPHVLYHWRSIPGSAASSGDAKGYALIAGVRALQDFFAAREPRIRVETGPWPATYRVRYPLPENPPLASLLVPTRDGLSILRRCIESVHAKTSYPRFEIVVVDNESKDRGTLDYLDELEKGGRARVVRYPYKFNYSAINNLAAREARGDVLVLLNNDVEVVTASWLEELVAQALRPEIGAVGAQLLYPNDTIQHAGVMTGLYGIAAHVHRYLPRDSPGYFARAQVVQQMSVVTGACLAVRKSVYAQLGGLDEKNLPVAFNDLDFCLRCIEAGYRNLYTPYARLYHHESYSRGADDTPEKRARFALESAYIEKRWGSVLAQDPCYNPNLSLSSDNFALAWPPRTRKPWKREATK